MEQNYHKRGYLLEDFRLFHLAEAPSSSIDFHYHEFHKILLLISGAGYYNIEGNRYHINTGDVVLVGSRQIHRPEFEAPYERLIIYVAPDFVRGISAEDCNLEECFSHDPKHIIRANDSIRSIIDQLEQELSVKDYGSAIAAKGLLLRLMVELCREKRSDETALSPLTNIKNERIAELISYIDSHLFEHLSIDFLAEQTYLSKYHLMRLFRENTGMTILSYITDRRLIKAKELILSGTNATEACYQTGFRSYSSFTRAYAKRFGTTPTGRKDTRALAEETYE